MSLGAKIRLALSHRHCEYAPWACSDGWYCGGCNRFWDLTGAEVDQ